MKIMKGFIGRVHSRNVPTLVFTRMLLASIRVVVLSDNPLLTQAPNPSPILVASIFF